MAHAGSMWPVIPTGDGAVDAGHCLRIRWKRRGTDIGSSGSGIFAPSGALVGVLSGGFGDCEGTPGPDHNGRFDLAYRAALSVARTPMTR
jgi:hypothetical protein